MKTSNLYQPFYLILFIVVFGTLMNAQEISKVAKNNQANMEQLYYPDASAGQQIAKFIRNTFQDKNGNLWFGTNGYGVAHYNGESLSYYSSQQGFNGGQILGITEDLEQNIWFATDQGIVKYDWLNTTTGEKKFINYSDPMVFPAIPYQKYIFRS